LYIKEISLLMVAVLVSVFARANDPVIPFDENIVTVLDADVSDPLPGVNIYNNSKSFTAFTNEKGQVDISSVAPNDTLFFSFLSYDEIKISVKDIRHSYNRIYLQSSSTDLGEVIVYGASKHMERSDDIPPVVEVIDSKEVEFSNPQTSADMLANTGSVFVQKSQMGGGSPIIRGFEANKILIVLDGVRMNNAIYRAGHLQNVISIDNATLERTEIVYGPASIIYGSDALGGVMHFYTKMPKYHAEGDKKWEANAMTRFATANLEKTIHADINFGNEKWATLLSVSYSDFDDLLAGKVKHREHPEGYGERKFYVGQIDDRDTVLFNDNPFRQIGTAYGRFDITQKTRFKPHEDIDLMLNLQYSTTTDVPRYDQLTEGSFSEDNPLSYDFKFAEWNYGPQSRLMAALSANIRSKDNLFDEARIIAAFQKIDEDRITRNFGNIWKNFRSEDVSVYSVNADLNKEILPGVKVLYGAEFTYNKVKSTALREDLSSGNFDNRLPTRYPDGGSNTTGFAVYANTNAKIHKGLNLMGGIRYSYITLSARFLDTSFVTVPYADGRITFDTPTLTGSLGMAWDMGKGYHLHTVASNAFRAPNVDDVGKIRSKNSFVTIPTPSENVVAEKSLNAEISLAKNFDNKVRLSGTYFYTYLFDAIVQRRDTIGDGTTLYYDGAFDTIQTNINAGEAFIYGTSASLLADLNDALRFKASVNYTFGHNISDSNPLAHIPPLYGLVSLNYEKENTRLELVSRFNGRKGLARYSDNSSDNLDQATPIGTPSWYTLNFYAAHRFTKRLRLTFGIENILDKHYRPFSSGVSAAGRNFVLGLQANL